MLFLHVSIIIHIIKKIFSSNGFVLIYNDKDLQEKIISKKLINDKIEVAHNSLPYGTLLNLRNPQKDTSLDVKVLKKSKYPDFTNWL